MSTTEELLKNEIKLAEGVGQLAESVNKAVSILARAILELEDPEYRSLKIRTRNALQLLAETEIK